MVCFIAGTDEDPLVESMLVMTTHMHWCDRQVEGMSLVVEIEMKRCCLAERRARLRDLCCAFCEVKLANSNPHPLPVCSLAQALQEIGKIVPRDSLYCWFRLNW